MRNQAHNSSNGDSFQLAVAVPHEEGSSVAVARAAARSRQLGRLYTALHTTRWMPVTKCLPPRLRAGVSRELGRRSFSQIPPECIETAAQISQLVYIAALRLPGPHSWTARSMYDAKDRFDVAVGRRLRGHQWDAVLAINASAEATLKAARAAGMRAVLNFLDSHPTYQNRFLKEFWAVPDGHPELVAPHVMDRVERELELADLIFVPSHFVARQLERTGVPSAKIAVHPYGVDLEKFYPRSDRPGSDPRERLVCLYVGQISHRKGVRTLLHAAQQLRKQPIEVRMIGPMVSPEVLGSVPENVRWDGPRAYVGVPEIMRQADLFVLPSVEDAYGLVAVEAMASGLPVIVSDHAGSSEVISNGRDGIVVAAGDVQALVEAIERLLESADFRAAMGEAARLRVESENSWSAYGDAVLQRIRTG